jgi:replicative DNA helicase
MTDLRMTDVAPLPSEAAPLPGFSSDFSDEFPLTRVPPHDLQAEQAVLGSMMISKDAVADVIDVIDPKRSHDFYRPAHAAVFEVVVSLFGRGEPTDAVSVAAELGRRGKLERVGGAAYLHTLIAMVPTAANAGYYARIVAEKAILRRLAEVGQRITQIGFGNGDAADAADTASAALHAALDTRRGGEARVPADTLAGTIEELERLAHHAGSVTGLPTGFHDLDECLGGLRTGQLVVVAGRPGLGKSTLALDFARHCAVTGGQTALLFSLEMSVDEINMRMLSAEARVSLQAMRTGNLDDAAWRRMVQNLPRVLAAPLYVNDSADLTLMSIRAESRRVAARHGLALVIIDYLQLLSHGDRRPENRQQEVSAISRSLKLLAKELGVPVVALSQLNRDAEQRANKRPQLWDLRESGAIEQDSDVVILVHREDAYDTESPRAGEADLILAKHRNGPTGTITVAFQGHYSRFIDMAT